jgi:hypothetical protein
MAAQGLDVVGDNPAPKRRLQLMADMYGFMAGEFPKLLDRWDQHKQAATAAQSQRTSA